MRREKIEIAYIGCEWEWFSSEKGKFDDEKKRKRDRYY